MVPTDVTWGTPGRDNPTIGTLGPNLSSGPLAGVTPSNKFPKQEELKGSTDFILVQTEDQTVLQRESPYLVTLSSGTVLASVKRPSAMGMIHTEVGEVAFAANSDAFISYKDGVLRVRNIDGMGATLKVRINKGPETGKTYAVSPGYELVISDHKLSRSDLRPTDGILRRKSQAFENGFAAVSQFHVESAISQSSLVSKISKAEGDAKSKRIVSDMSRMAAVLNHVQGTGGFTNK